MQWQSKKGGVVVVRQGEHHYVAKYSEKHQRSLHNCLKREGVLMAECNHPLLVKYVSEALMKAPTGNKTIDYLLLEYCPRGDLFEMLELDKEISYQLVKGLAAQVATQLQDMHDKKIAHLDVKLENIFIRQDCTVLLADLGSAQSLLAFDPLDQGTYFYMAPEVHRNGHYKTTYDPIKADAHSLGVLLFALVFLEFPWSKACQSNAKYSAFLKGRVAWWSEKQKMLARPDEFKELLSLIDLLLEPVPANRLSIKALLKHISQGATLNSALALRHLLQG